MGAGWLESVSNWMNFAIARMPELWFRTGQHLILTGVSTGLAIAIGLPLGILASTKQWLRATVLGTIGIFQTVPSLAMLAILLTLVGKIGAVPAIIALTIYALLPIVRNTVTGIEGVPPEVVRDVLVKLAGVLDDTTMQSLNFEVDEKGRNPEDVVRDFLREQGFLTLNLKE